jgi:drug/metabolite transporter (DMT)-like permease
LVSVARVVGLALSSKNENIWVFALIAVTVLWGWSFTAIHQVLVELSASTFNAYRFIVGAIVMLPFVAKKLIHSTYSDWRVGSFAGFVLFLAFTFQTSGIAYTTASNAAFITGLAVIFTPFLAKIFLKENPKRQQIIGAVLAAIGLAMLTIKNFSVHIGDVLILACAVFTALHIIVLAKVSKNHDVALLAFIQVLVVALLSLLWVFLSGKVAFSPSPQTNSTILIMGVAGTAIAYFVQTKAQVQTAPNKIALIIVLEPVFGGLFGYFLSGDRLTTINIIGAVLIIVAMVVTEMKLREKFE